MELGKKNILLIHALLWVLLFIPLSFSSLLVYENSPEIMERIIPNINYAYLLNEAFINLGSLVITFYLFYFFLFKWLFIEKISVKNGFLSVGLILAIFYLEGFLLNWVGKDLSSDYKGALVISVTRIILISFRVGFALGLRGIIKYFLEKQQREKTELLHEQSQLDLFRAKVNPHFLFNMLNNIDSLIHSNPDKASEVLIKLSDQMRYMVYESDAEKVPLEKELNFIKDYVFLEKLRLSNPDSIEFKVIGTASSPKLIPPMLFIAFIENAFKHRSRINESKTTSICISIEEQWIKLSVDNPFDEMETNIDKKPSGVGLPLVKKRLEHLYTDSHYLEIKKQNKSFTVNLAVRI
jgi:two-component system LytT family sensor kinase